jgi:cell division protein FtsL
MNEERLYRNNLHNTEYTSGNAVRKLEPQRRETPDNYRKIKKRQESQSSVNESALPMSAPYVGFLVVVSFICLGMCVLYLNIQSRIRTTRDDMSELRTNISTVQTENNALSYAINSYVDVDYIYKEAKNKLGMRQATDNQITTYKSSDNGYTLQYGDIPSK